MVEARDLLTILLISKTDVDIKMGRINMSNFSILHFLYNLLSGSENRFFNIGQKENVLEGKGEENPQA